MSKGWDFQSFNERYCSDAIILSLPSVEVNVDPMAAGCWLLVTGCWLLVTGCWLLAAGCWLLATVDWRLVQGPLSAGCWLFWAIGCKLVAGYCGLDNPQVRRKHKGKGHCPKKEKGTEKAEGELRTL